MNLIQTFTQHKIIRFIVSGGIGAMAQISFLYFFTSIIGLWYILSGMCAFVCSQIVSFLFHKLWTFKNFNKDNTPIQGALFLCTGVLNLVLNTVLLYLFVDGLDIPYLGAQLIASPLLAIFSFFIYKSIFHIKI